MATAESAPIRKIITVKASQAKAFEVFTASFGKWWPQSHKIGKSAYKTAIIEPRAGGRWYEIGEDGVECDWGNVLIWEPPARLVLAWRIRADWKYDPNLLTEVEVRFHPAGATETRVELEHRRLENLGDSAEMMRQTFDSDHGWGGILKGYAARVAA
jgi:uncharacterized protein YndB with AHSA1/START domain